MSTLTHDNDFPSEWARPPTQDYQAEGLVKSGGVPVSGLSATTSPQPKEGTATTMSLRSQSYIPGASAADIPRNAVIVIAIVSSTLRGHRSGLSFALCLPIDLLRGEVLGALALSYEGLPQRHRQAIVFV